MSRYRRMYVTRGRYFFTVNIAHRGQDVLVRHIEVLRHAVRMTRAERPFEIGKSRVYYPLLTPLA